MTINKSQLKSSRFAAFTLVELLVVIAIIGTLIALLLPAVQAARESARRSSCQNQTRQIAIAFQLHDSARKVLPAGAKYGPANPPPSGGAWYDQHGWYSAITSFIEEGGLEAAINYDIPFSDPKNDTARRWRVKLFECPSDSMARNEWPSANWARWRGNYAVNFGNTYYGQGQTGAQPSTAGYPAQAKFFGAPFAFYKSRPLKNIPDGTSNTLMVAEIRTIKEYGDTWGGPISDFSSALGGQTFEGTLKPNDPTGDRPNRVACIANNNSCTEQVAVPLAALDGVPACECSPTALDQYFATRSKHRGGVNVACCDASVHFIGDGVDIIVWRALTTAAGGSNQGESSAGSAF